MLVNETYKAIETETQIITEQAQALEAYFLDQRAWNSKDNSKRNEWSRYVFRVTLRKGRRPVLGWYSVTPIPMPNSKGGKKVVPREKYLKIGGRGATEYSSATFHRAQAWEQSLVWEVEGQAATLRRRMNELAQIKEAVNKYLSTTKNHIPAIRRYTQQ